MTPVLALVGRPNVGKSTLFNALTRSRDALVAELPGVTRDRRYGVGRVGERDYIVVDTGGLGPQAGELEDLMAQQTRKALEEADVVLFLVDAREGLTAQDQTVAESLRPLGKPVVLVLNKIDGVDPDAAAAEFHALGLGEPRPISAAHRRGVSGLVEHALGPPPPAAESGGPSAGEEGAAVSVALIGRPNVGKSTLVNRLLGEERVLASALPGTTRDALAIPFRRGGRDYELIDTAGVRRRARVQEKVEKFSVIKTLEAIERAQVVVLLLDAREGLAEQDLTLLGHVLEAGRALVIAVNKWDGLPEEQRRRLRAELDRRLGFVDFAEVLTISALHGTGVGLVMEAVDRAHDSATRHFATARLTRILEDLTAAHPPPAVRGRRIRLRYAHQGGRNPPVIVVHGNQVERLPDSYRRYLANGFSRRLGLRGTPLRLELRAGENPFAGRSNRLTPRQQRRRKRLLRHARGGR